MLVLPVITSLLFINPPASQPVQRRARHGTACCSATSCALYGLSVSEHGFVALLHNEDLVLPIPINEDMDIERVVSPEALTLLQLMQGIDMATPILPPERLSERVAAAGEPAATALTLAAVAVGPAGTFGLRVMVGSDTLEVAALSAFEAVALALRYRSHFEVAGSMFAEDGFPIGEVRSRFPACYTTEDAFAQRASVSSELARAAEPLAPPPQSINGPSPDLLRKALLIARQKGDFAAEVKILQMLSSLESGEVA